MFLDNCVDLRSVSRICLNLYDCYADLPRYIDHRLRVAAPVVVLVWTPRMYTAKLIPGTPEQGHNMFYCALVDVDSDPAAAWWAAIGADLWADDISLPSPRFEMDVERARAAKLKPAPSTPRPDPLPADAPRCVDV